MDHKKNWHEQLQSFLRGAAESNKASMAMYGIGMLLVSIIIFQAGMLVGTRKSAFMHEQAQRLPLNRQLPAAHGTAGPIIGISLPRIIVADQDRTEKTIFVRPDTLIRSDQKELLPEDLQVGNFIVVIGTPDPEGTILANLIRVQSAEK